MTLGAVTVDQAIHFLAVTAAKAGDTDTANPYLAYGGFGGPDAALTAAAIGDLQVLIREPSAFPRGYRDDGDERHRRGGPGA